MSYNWYIAKRFIKSNRKSGFISFITGFSILGVTLGTAALIITLSILAGFEKEIKDKVFGFMTHIQVQGFQEQPLTDYDQNINLLKSNIKSIKGISPYIAKEGMIRAGENVDGVLLKGIDVENDLLTLKKYIVSGSYLSLIKDTSEILIGKKLALKLDVNINDKVVVLGLTVTGNGLQPKAQAFRVVGIFESGMSEYDDLFAYTHLKNTQKLFSLESSVLGYDVVLDSLGKAKEVAKEIQDLLEYPHYARTAEQLYRNLFAWIELQKKPAPILLGLIIIVAVVNIIGTLLMIVLERMNDIGILKSLGMSNRSVQLVFLYQGLFISIVGIGLGNLLAYSLCIAQLKLHFFSLPSDIYYMTTVPILLQWENFVVVSLVITVLCLLTSLIPARAASKLDVITSLRFS